MIVACGVVSWIGCGFDDSRLVERVSDFGEPVPLIYTPRPNPSK
jgi:hypothetical protein